MPKHLARSKRTAVGKSFGRTGAGSLKSVQQFTPFHILKKMHILLHAALWRTMSEKNVNKCEKISEHDHIVSNFGRTRERYWFFEKMHIFLLGFVCTLKSAVLKDNERQLLVLKIAICCVRGQIPSMFSERTWARKNPEDRWTPAANCTFCASSSEHPRGRFESRCARGLGFYISFEWLATSWFP